MANFAAGLITGLDKLITKLNSADVMLAHMLLESTYLDSPRPPWNTGQLRSSGAAYIGATLIATTPETGPNPNGSWLYENRNGAGGASVGSAKGEAVIRTRARASELNIKTVRGHISIIYRSPHAALMHEWDGGFSDSESGKHFISLKLISAGELVNKVFRIILG